MARDEVYRIAETKTEAARRSEARELDISVGYDGEKPKLTELPEWLGQLAQLSSLDLSGTGAGIPSGCFPHSSDPGVKLALIPG